MKDKNNICTKKNISSVSPDEYFLVCYRVVSMDMYEKPLKVLMLFMVNVDLVHVMLTEQEFLIYVQLQI